MRYEELSVGQLVAGNPGNEGARGTPINFFGESLTAAKTLTRDDYGKTFFLNLAAGFAVTLPDPDTLEAGWKCKFIVGTAPTGDYTVVTNGGDNLIDGSITVAGVVVAAANEDTITFIAAAGAGKSGDWVELESDGTNWYISGQATTTGAITASA